MILSFPRCGVECMTADVRILLIDDHTLFRESLVRLLAGEAGLKVVGHCATLAEARKVLSETQVHVVLLDYDLGEATGTDLLRFLRENGNGARVLMLTAGMRASATLKIGRASWREMLDT